MPTRFHPQHWPLPAVGFIFLIPFLSGLIGRLIKGRLYSGNDFETIMCGGALGARGESRYAIPGEFHCVEYDVQASFIYLPWTGDVAHTAVLWLGPGMVHAIWAGIFFLAIGVAIYVPFFSKMPFASVRERLPFACLLTGSVIYWGNIAGLVYGLFALAALVAPKRPLILFSVIIFAAAIKQVWLTGLVVFLLIDMAWWKRWAVGLSGAILGLAPTLWFVCNGAPSEVAAWYNVTRFMAMDEIVGGGLLGWIAVFGLPTNADWVILAWAIFAAALTLAALGLAEHHKLTGQKRVWLGLSIATLVIPRLVSYEIFLLAPGIVIVLNVARETGAPKLAWWVYGACVTSVLLSIANLADYEVVPVAFTCSLAVLWTGLPHWRCGLRAVLPKAWTAASFRQTST